MTGVGCGCVVVVLVELGGWVVLVVLDVAGCSAGSGSGSGSTGAGVLVDVGVLGGFTVGELDVELVRVVLVLDGFAFVELDELVELVRFTVGELEELRLGR